MIPKIQKNNSIYGVTTGLWLIASGTSPVTPGGTTKPLHVLSEALWCSVRRLLLERHISLAQQSTLAKLNSPNKETHPRKTLTAGNDPDSGKPKSAQANEGGKTLGVPWFLSASDTYPAL